VRARASWFTLFALAVPVIAAGQGLAGSVPPQVCQVNPPQTSIDFVVDASSLQVTGPRKHGKSALPRLIIINKNPFLHEYKITVAETPLAEPDLGGFLKLLGGPAVDLLPAPEAKASTPPPPGPPIAAGTPSEACDRSFNGIVAGEADVLKARTRADAALAVQKADYDRVAAIVKSAEALFKTNAVCSVLYPTGVNLLAALDAYKPKLDDLEEVIAALSVEVKAQRKRLDDYPTSCARDITPNQQINEGQQAAVDKLKAALKQLTAEKARFDALREKIEPIMASPTSFTEVRQLGDYELPTNVKITIERKERVEKATFAPVVTATLHFGGGQRFVIAGGWSYSHLEKPQYQPVQGYPLDREGALIKPEALGPIVGVKEDSTSRNGPIAILHTRLWPEYKFVDHVWLSFGITAKNDNKGLDAEYLIGPSIGFAEDRAFVTLGVYGGRVQELQGQLYRDAPIPKELAEIPVEKNLHWRLGAAVSWKIR
jgi:hypothetical protein